MRFRARERVIGRQGDEERLAPHALGREPGVVERRPHEADVDAPVLAAPRSAPAAASRGARAPPAGSSRGERCETSSVMPL